MSMGVGVFVHYGVSIGKGRILMVTEENYTVSGSWMRLGCLKNWLSVRSVKQM